MSSLRRYIGIPTKRPCAKERPCVYVAEWSPPCRTVLLVEDYLGVKLTHMFMNTCAGRQYDDFYKPVNPAHTVPGMEDDGHFLGDSHAIAIYLVEKYGGCQLLYPIDPKLRSVIHSRMFFEAGHIYPLIKKSVLSLRLTSIIENRDEFIAEANKIYKLVNFYLEDQSWVAGPFITLADFCMITSMTSLNSLAPMDRVKYKNVIDWMFRMNEFEFYSPNRIGLWRFEQYMNSICKMNYFPVSQLDLVGLRVKWN